MFEKSTRQKLRFESPKGNPTVEDLWDLPLTSATGKANLDDIARTLYCQLKNDDTVSFVKIEQKSDETVQLKFDVVKHVIDVRLEENATATRRYATAEKKQNLLAIIAQKESETLMGASLDELKAMVASL